MVRIDYFIPLLPYTIPLPSTVPSLEKFPSGTQTKCRIWRVGGGLVLSCYRSWWRVSGWLWIRYLDSLRYDSDWDGIVIGIGIGIGIGIDAVCEENGIFGKQMKLIVGFFNRLPVLLSALTDRLMLPSRLIFLPGFDWVVLVFGWEFLVFVRRSTVDGWLWWWWCWGRYDGGRRGQMNWTRSGYGLDENRSVFSAALLWNWMETDIRCGYGWNGWLTYEWRNRYTVPFNINGFKLSHAMK